MQTSTLPDKIATARQGMAFVVTILQSAHELDSENPFAEIVLLDLVGEAAALEKKLERVAVAREETDNDGTEGDQRNSELGSI